jgi:hypothetical protein
MRQYDPDLVARLVLAVRGLREQKVEWDQTMTMFTRRRMGLEDEIDNILRQLAEHEAQDWTLGEDH